LILKYDQPLAPAVPSYGVILTPDGKLNVIKRDEGMKWFGTSEDYLTLHNQWVTGAQVLWFTGDDFD
jgi:hypothetical protein